MNEITEIKEYADYLRLTNLRNNAESIIHQAQIDSPTYMELIHKIVYQEVKQRQQSNLDKRRKLAKLLTNGYNFTN